MRSFAGILFLLFMLRSAVPAQAQHKYITLHFTQKNGLPQNCVTDLWFDNNNYLWVTTEDGLARFDGKGFRVFRTAGLTPVSNDRFYFIIQTPEKEILASTAKRQLWKIDQHRIRWHKYSFKKDAPGKTGAASCMDLIDHFYSINKNVLLQNEHMILPSQFVHAGGDTTLLLGPRYIYLIRGSNTEDSVSLGGIVPQRPFIHIGNRFYFISIDGKIYTLSSDFKAIKTCGVIPELTGKTFSVYWTPNYIHPLVFHSKKIYTLHINTTSDSICLSRLLDSIPVEAEKINRIAYDARKNVIAIATVNAGLYVIKPRLFKTQPSTGQPAGYAQIPISDSSVLNTSGYAIGSDHIVKSPYHIPDFSEFMLLKDQHGGIWFSGRDSVYLLYNGKTYPIIYKGNVRVSGISLHHDTLFVGAHKTIYMLALHFKNGKYEITPLKKIASGTNPLCFAFFKSALYYGCEEGIYFFNTGKAPAHKKLFSISNVRFLLPLDSIMLGCSYGEGFFALYNERLIRFPMDRKMYLSKASSMLIDRRNRIFISTNTGLFYTTLTTVQNYVAGKQKELHYQYYNDEDGIDNPEFNGGCTQSSVALVNGYFSFSNMNGFVWFRPDSLRDYFPDGPFYIDEIRIDSTTVAIADTVHIPAYAEQVSLLFSSPYWGNPYSEDISYKIQGYSSEWMALSGKDLTVAITNLPGGNFRLLIRKKTGFGKNDYLEQSVLLIKEKKYFETLVFKIGYMLILVALVLGFIDLYNKSLIKRNQLLEQRVAQRTEELLQSNQKLQQSVDVKNKLISIISHDIVAPLKFISMVSRNFKNGLKKPGASQKEVLSEIHITAQHLSEHTRNILNWISYQNRRIEASMQHISPFAITEDVRELLLKVAKARKNEIINEVDMDDIVKTDKNILTIILQNLVSNAIKYNFACTVKITSSSLNNTYQIMVTDNGQGMSEGRKQQIESILENREKKAMNDSADGSGLGFIIVYEMALLIGATVRIRSKLGTGTAISVELPFEKE